MEGLKALQACDQTSDNLTEPYEHNFEIQDVVLSSQNIYLNMPIYNGVVLIHSQGLSLSGT